MRLSFSRLPSARSMAARFSALFSVVFLLGLFDAANANASAQNDTDEPASRSAKTSLVLKPCHVAGVAELARCGMLDVPEDHDDPDGAAISLHIAILPPSGGQPTKEPLYFLAGGPGQAATEQGKLYDRLMRRIRRGRDLVLVDQRGTGRSNPFKCDVPDNPLADGADVAARCLEGSDQQTEFYTSDDFVKDLDLVRRALGHETISLMGISYGTRAALLYAKAHEEHIRAMVLDSVAPPNVPIFGQAAEFASKVLDRTIDACTSTQACNETFPTLKPDFASLLQRLEQTPQSLSLPEVADMTIDVDRELFLTAFRGALYAPPAARLIPFVIDQAHKNNFDPWLALADFGNLSIAGDLSMGLMLSVQCAEELPFLGAPQSPSSSSILFADNFEEFWVGACNVWPHGIPPEGFNDPVTVATPTLLLSGGLDPITPPSMGDIAAETLENARHIIVPEAGHSVIAYGCTNRLVATFLDSADEEDIDVECLEKVGPPAFLTGLFGPKP